MMNKPSDSVYVIWFETSSKYKKPGDDRTYGTVILRCEVDWCETKEEMIQTIRNLVDIDFRNKVGWTFGNTPDYENAVAEDVMKWARGGEDE